MNYLAHIFLSGNDTDLQIGNFIADFVKGKKLYAYPEKIQKGIILHRQIDEFTDNHPIVKELNSLLYTTFGRYSPIILDMYFDYVLANSFSTYSKKKLLQFTLQFNLQLVQHYTLLPERVKRFVFHFILTNRLYQYKSIRGLHDSLHIMSVHKSTAIQPVKSIDFLVENEEKISQHFHLFFTDVLQFVANKEVIRV